MDTLTFQWLEKLIKENTCSGAELSSGILQVIFGNRRLVVQSSWRLVSNSDIVVASDSDAEQSETVVALLDKLIVDRVLLASPFNDLEIHFAGGAFLQTFADSEKHEHWYFTGGPQEMIVAGPGKLWSSFKPLESS